MAVTIKLTANPETGAGVDFNAFMVSYFSDFTMQGWPYILGGSNTFQGDQIVLVDAWESERPDTKAIVLDGLDFNYYFASHTLSGTLRTVRLTTLGDSYNASDQSFSQDGSGHINNVSTAVEISGLSVSNPYNQRGDFHDLVAALMGGVDGGGANADATLLRVEVSSEGQILLGSTGNDKYSGTAFRDVVYGKGGNDTLSGGLGNDLIDGGTGSDRMSGGQHNDVYMADRTADRAIELTNQGTDTVKSTATFVLGANVEHLTLTGSVIANGTGNGLANFITGNGAANKLIGGAGNDTLKGLGGIDKLQGGVGADKLFGGVGKDTFVFKSTTESKTSLRDSILDFSRGADKIDLSAIDANRATPQHEDFSFVGTTAFNGIAGELRFQPGNGGVVVYGNTNPDKTADFAVYIDNLGALLETDFVL